MSERESGARGATALDGTLDQPVPIQNRMDGADGRNPHLLGQPAHQELPDLPGAPVGLVLLGPDDRGLNLARQLIGIADRPPGAVRQSLEPVLLVAPEDLVSGLPGDAELPAHLAHRLAFQEPGHETQALVYDRTLFPRHRHPPPAGAGGGCYPCVRNKTSPTSRVGHSIESSSYVDHAS